MSTTSIEPDRKAVSAADWKRQARHTVVLPSGATIDVRIPDITAMLQTGELPQHLLAEAVKAVNTPEGEAKQPTPEELAKEVEFKNAVVLATVVAPKITEADLDPRTGIPTEDKDMIVSIALRQAEFDAEGNHLAGLDRSAKFRKFRGIASLYEDVEGLPGSE